MITNILSPIHNPVTTTSLKSDDFSQLTCLPRFHSLAGISSESLPLQGTFIPCLPKKFIEIQWVIQWFLSLEDHPRTCKWLGSPPFMSHLYRPFGRGPTTRSLGDLRSPWFLSFFSAAKWHQCHQWDPPYPWYSSIEERSVNLAVNFYSTKVHPQWINLKFYL